MSFNSNNFKKFAEDWQGRSFDISQELSPESWEDIMNREFRLGNVNKAQYASEVVKQMRNGLTQAQAQAYAKDILSKRGFQTKQNLANSQSARQFAQWQGRQTYNKAFNQLSLWDKLRYMFGGLMNKMGLGGKDSYYNKFNEDVKSSMSQGIREKLEQSINSEIARRLAISKGFIDEKGNPLNFNQMNPEQQSEFQKDWYSFYAANEKSVMDQMATKEIKEVPGGIHWWNKAINERVGKEYDETLKDYKTGQYISSFNIQQQPQPGQQTVTQGLTTTTPVASAQSYTGISYPKSSQPPSRIQSKINNANPRRRPQDSKKQSVVSTPTNKVSAKEAADMFNV